MHADLLHSSIQAEHMYNTLSHNALQSGFTVLFCFLLALHQDGIFHLSEFVSFKQTKNGLLTKVDTVNQGMSCFLAASLSFCTCESDSSLNAFELHK